VSFAYFVVVLYLSVSRLVREATAVRPVYNFESSQLAVSRRIDFAVQRLSMCLPPSAPANGGPDQRNLLFPGEATVKLSGF
jgi:hypothetical protein